MTAVSAFPHHATTAVADPGPAATDVDASDRSVDFDHDWKFVLVNPDAATDPTGAYAHAADPGYDDSAWRAVDLPHDWSIELNPTATAGTTSGTGFFQGGLGWYRKTFTLPPSLAGRRVSVEFDGVYMDSSVYLNGELLGNHPYGYTGFSLDLTGRAHTDGHTPDVLAVKVQNQLPSSRWYSGSGIYRNVHLTVTDPVHVTRHGTVVTTPDLATTVHDGYATVRVRTTVADDTARSRAVDVVTTVRDPHGSVVARTTAPLSLDPGGTRTGSADLRVRSPQLWSTDHPNLYEAQTDVRAGGRVVDSTRTPFGIRYYAFDPNGGFSLNGRPLKLYGVDMHHDMGAIGSAVSDDALLRQMTIMKSMGVNALRTSHNPPAPELVDVCQRLGIVMMVEGFDSWHTGKTTYDYHRFFDAWSDADITEMVTASRNSPAVVLWSIGNEIPDSTSAAGIPIAQRLIADVRAADPTRPIVMGSDKYRSVPAAGSPADQILRMLDGLGLNYNTAQSVDALHARYPDKFLFESESSSETSTRGVYQDPQYLNTGENHTPGKRGTSSYDNNLASWTMSGEYGLKKDRDRRYFQGQFLWSGFDYIGEPTPYDVFPVKSSFFGAVDTAGFAKDAYWLFRSQWTTQPMVHLLPMNWTDHQPGEHVQVWAYANVDTVELFLNGHSLGTRTFDHKTTVDGRPYLETTEPSGDDKTFPSGSYTSPNGGTGKLHLGWDVPYAPGRLVAVARRNGRQVARDEIDTAGPAATVRLTPDRRALGADGRSLSFLTAEVVDAHGVVVPDAGNELHVTVTGAGRLAGMDSGREESAESYRGPTRAAFNGKALAIVRSTGRAGPITVTVTSPGLAPTTTTLYAVAPGGDRHRLAGLVPVTVRTPLGRAPSLPDTVTAVYAGGATRAARVRWAPAGDGRRTGTRVVHGVVAGSGERATATVTVYSPASVAPVSAVVPVGQPPTLPATVRLAYSDGVTAFAPVSWDPIDPARYADAGRFRVTGAVAGTRLRAAAEVTVTAEFTPGLNLAVMTSPARPAADASYSGAPATVPAALLDGVTASGGWSNYYLKSATALLPPVSRSRPADWVSVSWPAPQAFGTAVAYFTTSADGRYTLPASLAVSWWNGTAYVPVRNLHVSWATASDQPTTLTFGPVDTTSLRIGMTSPTPGTATGFQQIAELQVLGDLLE